MWFKIQNKHVKINIFVKPNAKKTVLIGFNEQELIISIHAKPHKGAANKALIAYLSELFQVPKSQVNLQSGEQSRCKRIIVPLTESVQKFIYSNSNI